MAERKMMTGKKKKKFDAMMAALKNGGMDDSRIEKAEKTVRWALNSGKTNFSSNGTFADKLYRACYDLAEEGDGEFGTGKHTEKTFFSLDGKFYEAVRTYPGNVELRERGL